MSYPQVDANIIIRLLSGDDKLKQKRAAQLFDKVEKKELVITTPLSTIADIIYVLTSPDLYHLPRANVVKLLYPLVKLPNFKIKYRKIILSSLEIFSLTKLDFGDAVIAAQAISGTEKTVYSYDRDFDHFKEIVRKEP